MAWLVGACGDAAPVCRFGPEHALFQSEAQSFHGLSVVSLGGEPLALFSDARGMHAQWLDPEGRPRGSARRLTDACDGGFAAIEVTKELRLACARRGSEHDASGELVLYRIDAALAPPREADGQRLASLGPDSRGVALARAPGGEIALLWHSAALSGESIWYVELPAQAPAETASITPTRLSDAEWDAAAPGLVSVGGRLHAVWSESQWRDGPIRSRVVLGQLSGRASARTRIQTRDPAPSPHLIESPDGLILAYRDKREVNRRPGLYLTRLDAQGRPVGRPVRAGRADGDSDPALTRCLGGVVSATPRTFAGDYFVGVTWADQELHRLTQEQQFYEDSREFDRVAMHCGRSEALLLIGERGRLLRGGAALHATTFRCQ